MKKILPTLLVSMLLFPTFSLADEGGEENKRGPKAEGNTSLSVGYGLMIKKNIREGNLYRRGDKNTTIEGIPMVQADYGKFTLGPQGATMRITGDVLRSISGVLNYNGDRYEAEGMKGRKKGVFAGLLFKWGLFSFIASRDVEGKSDGWQSQFSYNEMFVITPTLLLRTSVYLKWNDKEYANYYYGVKPEEATASRPAYSPGAYFTPGAGIISIYLINKEFSLMTGGSLEYLVKKLQDSPTVIAQDIIPTLYTGLTYRF
jgi:outer membrane scaffolding protein for murein synthesis (MipA/OmpV family)